MNNQVEEVKSKIDIVSLIGEYIEVKKAGRNYKANCPFHGEKTPSFMISPELQMYKCFGCGKAGDAFTFLEEQEGMSFGEALKYLADKVGVTLTSFKSEVTSEREKIIEINKNALNFYEYVLLKHPKGKRALSYLLKDRELSIGSINKFKLGYSPDVPDGLIKYLTEKKKYTLMDLEKGGLIVKGRFKNYDRFGGRVIFPLFDHRDNVVGFAGRILPWDKRETGKYINSPETPAYHKSRILYGLNITKQEIKNAGFAVIVEGELDMISSYNAGIKNVIAIKGSALTEDQIRLIGRFCQKIVLSLDADFAGSEAAKRGAVLAFNLGFEVKVARIEGYKDPDEIAKKDATGYKRAIDESVSIWDFLIDETVKKNDLSTGEGKAKVSTEIVPLISTIEDKIVQAHYVEKLSRLLSVPVEAVSAQLRNKEKGVQNAANENKEVDPNVKKDRRILLEEKFLINSLRKDANFVIDKREYFEGNLTTKIIGVLENYLQESKSFDLSSFTLKLPPELKEGFGEMVLSNSEDEDLKKIFLELKNIKLKKDMESISQRIKKAEVAGNDTILASLEKEYSELVKKLSHLEED